MQTNAPAGLEFVDQYNRAVAFGQIGGVNGAPLPAHASTHATGGSDPVTPASIGATAIISNNIVTAPGQAMFRIDNVNLLAVANTTTVIYTVPPGFKLTVSNFKIIITSTNQSFAFAVAPVFWVVNTAGVRCMNESALTTGRVIASNDVFASAGSYGTATQRVISTDTLSLRVFSAFGGGTQSFMTATVVITGELYS